ncbi:hypothetical protein [Reyranella sp.]|nr:hypothetical protein [Reyranella sp.]MDO8976743.1 hypothetical protein [Reyranella sp.]
MTDRTVRRWAAGADVPAGVWVEIRELLKARGAAIAIVRRKLRRGA